MQPPGWRRIHVHVRRQGSPNQRYPLLFRDYLRAHPHSAATVERIKRALAAYHADDNVAYYAIKDPAYDLIWDAAQEWAAVVPAGSWINVCGHCLGTWHNGEIIPTKIKRCMMTRIPILYCGRVR